LKIDILGVSHQKRESVDYHNLRENGQPGFNFVHFLSPALVILDDIEYRVTENACIIYSPHYKQEYKSMDDILLNNFLTFQTGDSDFIARFNLPENEIFYIQNGDEITYILEYISWAVADKTEPHGMDIVERIYRLFNALSRQCIDNNPGQKRTYENKQRFIALRDNMRANPAGWTVAKMAKRVWLTQSRFSVLYSEFFKISPNADLMNMKVDYAKKLLMTTNTPIRSIAEMCGYKSVEYFIRLFSKNEKKSPLQYRKMMANKIDNSH